MMKNTKEEFLHSLDAENKEIEPYLPYILQDLDSLGSDPDYIKQLIKKNTLSVKNIIDLGCGKGEVLLQLGQEIDFNGLGIDMVSDFINAANQKANDLQLSQRIIFKVDDLKNHVSNNQQFEIVIYAFDAEILGDLKTTLSQLKKCVLENGFIILEAGHTSDAQNNIEEFPTERELYKSIKESGLNIKDQIVWEINKIKKVNEENSNFIQSRINELILKHPEKKDIFNGYMQNQLEECRSMETEWTCTTLLLSKTKTKLK